MVNVVQANIDVGEAEDREGLYMTNDHTCIHNNNSNSTGKAQEKQLFVFSRKASSGKNQALSYSVLFTREDAFSIFNCFQCTVMSQQQISWHILRSKTKRCCYKLDRTEKNSPEETESKFLVSEIDIFWRALMELGIY